MNSETEGSAILPLFIPNIPFAYILRAMGIQIPSSHPVRIISTAIRIIPLRCMPHHFKEAPGIQWTCLLRFRQLKAIPSLIFA